MAAAATSSRRRALISVSDKQGLLEFARGLVALDFEIVSTGGTRRFLLESGLPVTDISEYTGFPEMLDGRVKTLHPKVHGGLLGRPHLPADAQAMQAHGILPFALVAVNLYPFEATVARPDCPFHDAIENIDIGGPSMIRSAAKNHELVAIVTSPAQYAPVLEAFRAGELPLTLRRQLAAAAYETTARYDRAIANWFQGTLHPDEAFPRTFSPVFERVGEQLRYGENPQQAAAFYTEVRPAAGTLATTRQLHGKELSYNNLLDLDAALQLVREFDQPAAVVLKHNNPCGAAVATTLATAFDRAYAGDPVSAFGSILGFNRPVDLETALLLCVPDRFVEAIVAPAYTPEALEALTTRPKWKANVRLMECPGLLHDRPRAWDYRRVSGGLLVQQADDVPDPEAEWKVVTERAPTDAERHDLRFAWRVCKHVKSNAIVFAREGMVTGVGAGQMSRVDSVQIASRKSEGRCVGGVVASDAFFPFRDGLVDAVRAGVRAAIQPGGSKNDPDVIAACNELGVAMIFTGRRHFKH